MADTTFTSGTVVTSGWLNDTNAITYGLSSTAAGKGAGLVFTTAGVSVQAAIDAINATTALERGYVDTTPLVKLTPPTQFNDQLKLNRVFNGRDAVYLQDPYDAIDFTKNPDTAINSYYINYTTGLDTNAGTSSGAAWKTFSKAVTSAVSPAIIYLEDEWIGINSFNPSFSLNGNFKVKSAHASGKTRICNMNESYVKATYNWLSEGNGCWSTSTATTSSTIFGRLGHASFDAKYLDEGGGAMPLPQAASSAACIATAGTQYHDDAASKKYIHLLDGRTPDPYDKWIYSFEQGGFSAQQNAGTGGVLLYEGLQWYLNAGTGASAGCRYRNTNSTSANTSRFGLKNCLSYGAAANGFEIYDGQITAVSNSYARYNQGDGFNYHSFVSTGTKGEYITVYENNCVAGLNGWNGFSGQPTVGTSSNASTGHDSIHVERMNCKYVGGNGATVADVNGVVSINWCVDAGKPTGGAFKSCFWHDNTLKAGTYNGMYLWGCSAHDDGDTATRLVNNESQTGGDGSNDGQIYIKYWRGQTNGAVTGTLKDFSGTNL